MTTINTCLCQTSLSPQIQDGGRPRSWKVEKLPYLSRGLNDFDKIWQADLLRPSWASQPLKFELSKIQAGGGRHLEKSKIGHISGTIRPIFAEIFYDDAPC